MQPDANQYWDSVAESWHEKRPQRLWRAYCDALNGELIKTFLSGQQVERALKTDLFDEATSASGLIPILKESARSVVGIDLSHLTSRFAGDRHAELKASTADARSLPFADESFDIILSNSTLDHMSSCDDIAIALLELARVLRPGGRLLLTLDNLLNPVVALRNALPHRLLASLRFSPYYVGATCGPRRLQRMIEEAGLKPRHVGAMMHCPRVPAVTAANLLDRFGGSGAKKRFFGFLTSWEKLERLPTRYLSGYFITVLAARPSR